MVSHSSLIPLEKAITSGYKTLNVCHFRMSEWIQDSLLVKGDEIKSAFGGYGNDFFYTFN